MILSYGGVEFEDIRAPVKLDPFPVWILPQEIKQRSTWGQVPLLEIGDKKLTQSLAITRYLAKQFGLLGADDFEAALCDEYVDTVREFMGVWWPITYEKDEDNKNQKREETIEAMKEKYLNLFNKIVVQNGNGHLVGSGLTWADIYLAHALNNVELVMGYSYTKLYPGLLKLSDLVFNNPQIKKWVQERPVTAF